MAANFTYVPINTTTTSTSTATITFSSIPSTYQDLVIIINGANAGGSRIRYRFNSDSGTNYSRTSLTGNGSSAASYNGSNVAYAEINVIGGATALTAPYTVVTNIQNYSNTTTYKTLLSRFGSNDGTNPGVEATVNMWRSTSAINQIDITSLGGSFVSGTNFTLYGISGA